MNDKEIISENIQTQKEKKFETETEKENPIAFNKLKELLDSKSITYTLIEVNILFLTCILLIKLQ
jgi:hypothetical protein